MNAFLMIKQKNKKLKIMQGPWSELLVLSHVIVGWVLVIAAHCGRALAAKARDPVSSSHDYWFSLSSISPHTIKHSSACTPVF